MGLFAAVCVILIFGTFSMASYYEYQSYGLADAEKHLYWHLATMILVGILAAIGLHLALAVSPVAWIGFAFNAGVLGYLYYELNGIMDHIEALDGDPLV